MSKKEQGIDPNGDTYIHKRAPAELPFEALPLFMCMTARPTGQEFTAKRLHDQYGPRKFPGPLLMSMGPIKRGLAELEDKGWVKRKEGDEDVLWPAFLPRHGAPGESS